ncbi:MAG: threonine/serine exporter family protein [Nannocystaceae bacterium]
MTSEADKIARGPAEAAAMELVVRLGQALHRLGAPADRVEATMSRVSERLGVAGQFFAVPTSIHAAFGAPGAQVTFLVRLPPTGDLDLGRLVAVDALVAALARGQIGPAEADARLTAILAAPPRHPRSRLVAAQALVSGAAAVVLGGGAIELALAALLGLVVGAASRVRGASDRYSHVFPALAGLVVAAVAGAARTLGAAIDPWTVTLAALIVLVPGLSLTLAMREVTTGHPSAGAARLVGVVATFMLLGCGIALGDRLAAALPAAATTTAVAPLPAGAEAIALALTSVGLGVLFQVRARDLPWLMLGGLAAWTGSWIGAALLGPRLAPLIGALATGAAGNAVARRFDRPAAIAVVPGLMLLVPGSLGVRSLRALLADDVVGGVEIGFAMAFVAAALVSGLLLANVLVDPRRDL